ncbi:MAG: ATP-dependent DNA helicase RecG [Elusimicrobiota bacterium]
MATYSTSSPPSPVNIKTPIQFIKGVGPDRAELLKKLGLSIVDDLISFFPRTHQDRRFIWVSHLQPNQKAAVQGKVISIEIRQVGKMLGQARAVIQDASGTLPIIWFKRLSFKYDVFQSIKRIVTEGSTLFFYGSIEGEKDGIQMQCDDFGVIDPSEKNNTPQLVPVYPLTEGVQERWLRSLMFSVVPMFAQGLTDWIPNALRQSQGLIPLNEAVLSFHFPKDLSSRDQARHRLAFDEFFLLELAMALNRQQRESHAKGFVQLPTKKLLTPFKKKLGFEFTKAQVKVINQIFRDMSQPIPMNRLLQGDVGSGKTVVALSSALLAIENGRQVAILAPTEILAEQHLVGFQKMLEGLPIEVDLIKGSLLAKDRKRVLTEVKSGKIQILVGTHSILNEAVEFKELGLVIIDEQHRFGVRQRAKLSLKASTLAEGNWVERLHPDVLIMTATPIPRTLTMTLYGDLDVSIMDEIPEGRSPIKTQIIYEKDLMSKITHAVTHGQQVYMVFPLVDEAKKRKPEQENLPKSVKLEFERWKKILNEYSIGLIHGQMKSEEKNRVMNAFRKKEISILLATPVIEVGIDVPNATLIAIFNPERFGFSQLHQLRGRVGRGSVASECMLIRNEGELPNQRLITFSQISDGFRLSEEDLKLRGPGEILGEAQHGIPFFKVGDLIKDGLLIAQAREAANTLIRGEVSLTLKEYDLINRELHRKFGNKIHLSKVG